MGRRGRLRQGHPPRLGAGQRRRTPATRAVLPARLTGATKSLVKVGRLRRRPLGNPAGPASTRADPDRPARQTRPGPTVRRVAHGPRRRVRHRARPAAHPRPAGARQRRPPTRRRSRCGCCCAPTGGRCPHEGPADQSRGPRRVVPVPPGGAANPLPPRRRRADGATCPACGARWADPQYRLEETLDEYIEHLVTVFGDVKRVLTPTGTGRAADSTLYIWRRSTYGGCVKDATARMREPTYFILTALPGRATARLRHHQADRRTVPWAGAPGHRHALHRP